MTNVDPLLRRIAAPHEAAHLAGAYLLLGPTSIVGDAVVLEANDPWAIGHCHFDPEFTEEELELAHLAALLGLPPEPHLRDRIEGHCLALLAGGAYEASLIVRENLLPELPEVLPVKYQKRKAKAVAAGETAPLTDSQNVDAFLLRVTATNLEAFALRSWLDQRVLSLIHNPQFVAVAEALTDALHAAGRMSRAEITHCAYRALNPPPEPHLPGSGYYE